MGDGKSGMQHINTSTMNCSYKAIYIDIINERNFQSQKYLYICIQTDCWQFVYRFYDSYDSNYFLCSAQDFFELVLLTRLNSVYFIHGKCRENLLLLFTIHVWLWSDYINLFVNICWSVSFILPVNVRWTFSYSCFLFFFPCTFSNIRSIVFFLVLFRSFSFTFLFTLFPSTMDCHIQFVEMDFCSGFKLFLTVYQKRSSLLAKIFTVVIRFSS